MALYKGVEIDACLHGLVRYMADTEEYRETLQGLQSVWDSLTLLGQLSGTGADMAATRQAFQKLTGNLLNSLARETLKKTLQEMKSKAQVAVDIMIRNLFERTADIGFLATDEDICAYLESIRQPAASESTLDGLASRARLEERFRDYVRKYSVYADILLLSCDGKVVAQLDSQHPVHHSCDPLIAEALSTRQAYVETFRASDLQPRVGSSLIYSYRVTNSAGKALGVLCLCFRFENETAGIFANLRSQNDWSVISLLDGKGRVIASSDVWHLPVGAQLECVLDADWRVVRFAGREYLATTRPTQGYQGYMGPGWYGHVMLPLDHAFEQSDAGTDLAQVDADVLASVMANPALFESELQSIPLQAEQIQRELNRSVWNGNVRQRNDSKSLNPAFSKVLLWEISNTGLKTQDVFERSIGNLHATVVSAILQNSRFMASLAIDIMDRNLYERANDCRWWALTSVFRRQLADGGSRDLDSILAYINGLYTVYAGLLVYDRAGRVLAVSKPEHEPLRGQVLADDWVKQSLALSDAQSYCVSPFVASSLYGQRPTYIYAAAIRAADQSRVVGGIGIVFDAAPQFAAMLRDALPRDEHGEVQAGCFGVFAQANRRVIACSQEDPAPGSLLDLPAEYFNPAAGRAGILAYQGSYYAVGACPSRGYREFKSAGDSYHNEVTALIFVPLGQAGRPARSNDERRPTRLGLATVSRDAAAESVEVATFHVAGQWFGVRSDCVIEAIDAKGLTSVPGTPRNLFGYVMFRNQVMAVINLAMLMNVDEPLPEAALHKQIVVMRDGQAEGYVGLLVDQLGEIPEVPLDRIERLPAMIGGENQLAESMVKKRENEPLGTMLVILSVERIWARIRALHLPDELPATDTEAELADFG